MRSIVFFVGNGLLIVIMLQSERPSKSLLNQSFSPRMTGCRMGHVFERDQSIADHTATVSSDFSSDIAASATSSSSKSLRKRRSHSTGSPAGAITGCVSPSHDKTHLDCTEEQPLFEANSPKSVTFMSENRRTQKTNCDANSVNKIERLSRSTNVTVVDEEELKNLKDLVLLHLDIVNQQQQIIAEKDEVIANLRDEKNTVNLAI